MAEINHIGADFNLGQVPVMVQVFGSGGIRSFVELEKSVHLTPPPIDGHQ